MFGGPARQIINDIGNEKIFDGSKGEALLGRPYIGAKQSILDTAESVLAAAEYDSAAHSVHSIRSTAVPLIPWGLASPASPSGSGKTTCSRKAERHHGSRAAVSSRSTSTTSRHEPSSLP